MHTSDNISYYFYSQIMSTKKTKKSQKVDRISLSLREEEELKNRIQSSNLSEDDIKDIRADIKANKRSLTDRKSVVHKYEYQLALHKIDRALNEIESELADTSLTASQQQRLQSKRDELESQRQEIEEVYSVTSTIESIKHVIDLFK